MTCLRGDGGVTNLGGVGDIGAGWDVTILGGGMSRLSGVVAMVVATLGGDRGAYTSSVRGSSR